ncbi:hypothetical protein GCM10010466_34840 [Planomonospora alba]|uniref:Uncharacterized protein n=1 Tax=Planomonospora alba TaxID=161354 RepID=A0ABP6N9F9_9ACTN
MRAQAAQDPSEEGGDGVRPGGRRGVDHVAPLDLAAGERVQPGTRGRLPAGRRGQDGHDDGGGGAGITELVVAVREQAGGMEVVELGDRLDARSLTEERLGHGETGS